MYYYIVYIIYILKVLAECRRKFPEFTFLGDVSISKSASVSNRYNADSLRGIIVDIYMLSLTDYIVGTFSSQVRSATAQPRLVLMLRRRSCSWFNKTLAAL